MLLGTNKANLRRSSIFAALFLLASPAFLLVEPAIGVNRGTVALHRLSVGALFPRLIAQTISTTFVAPIKWMFNNRIVTVWSAPNYCYRCGNVAAILELNDNLEKQFRVFQAAPQESRVPPVRKPPPDYFL